jgi:hypothetical protein
MKPTGRFGCKLAEHISVPQSVQSVKNAIRTHFYVSPVLTGCPLSIFTESRTLEQSV